MLYFRKHPFLHSFTSENNTIQEKQTENKANKLKNKEVEQEKQMNQNRKKNKETEAKNN